MIMMIMADDDSGSAGGFRKSLNRARRKSRGKFFLSQKHVIRAQVQPESFVTEFVTQNVTHDLSPKVSVLCHSTVTANVTCDPFSLRREVKQQEAPS
jgi:hypothetical protein